MALFNILESQRNEIFAMLDYMEQNSGVDIIPSWKILLYDAKGQTILSNCTKLGALRLRGITLHMLLNSADRGSVATVPAVYFCKATDENIQLIEEDLKFRKQESNSVSYKHSSFRINFIDTISSDSLRSLAMAATESGAANLVETVRDTFLDFISISSTEFELNLPGATPILRNQSDPRVEPYVSSIVGGLLSVCITLRVMPIIRCSSSRVSPSYVVANMLLERLWEANQQGLIRGSIPKGKASIAHRPLLILADRSIDYSVLIEHAWTYRGLINDLTQLSCNRLTYEVDGKTQNVELDDQDPLWSKFMDLSFPDLLTSISDEVSELEKKRKTLPTNKVELNAASLDSAISALPGLSERKKYVDLHTDISSKLLDVIKGRCIDSFYELEEGLLSGTLSPDNAASSVTELFKNKTGSPIDRLRCLLVFLSTNIARTEKEQLLRNVEAYLIKDYPNYSKVANFVMRSHNIGIRKQTNTDNSKVEDLWDTKVGRLGRELFQQGKGIIMQGVKVLVGMERKCPLTAMALALTAGEPQVPDIVTFDPFQRSPQGTYVPLPPINGTFNQTIVFVLGEGSYTESHNLRSNFSKSKNAKPGSIDVSKGGSVVYGCTAFESPTDFIKNLETIDS